MTTTENQALLSAIVPFLNSIGIPCTEGNIPADSFLPGITVRNGGIVYDLSRLAHPGDLLHEAGHLAVLRPAHRVLADGSQHMVGDLHEASAEMGAIAWSWAAKEALGLDASVLFHPDGYRGAADTLIANFSDGCYVGVPMLQWFGMTEQPHIHKQRHAHTYPGMQHWLRQS